MKGGHDWALVLAAGDGRRLSILTDGRGGAVPKQYWSLRGRRSLLGDALRRADRLVGRERTVVIVAADHRHLWEPELRGRPAANVIVQHANRGTAAGLLLPALAILDRDPDARLAVLPSDHFVDRERALGAALRSALRSLAPEDERLVLLGIEPDAPESGYGWILPGDGTGLAPVERFVEKPSSDRAAELLAAGGLWNSFLFATRVHTLCGLFAERLPELFDDLRAARRGGAAGLAELYERMPSRDFSREVVEGSERRLRVLRVEPCGWTDLGTPERLANCVQRLAPRAARPAAAPRFRFAEALARAVAWPAAVEGPSSAFLAQAVDR